MEEVGKKGPRLRQGTREGLGCLRDSTTYLYGYPSGGPTEANVACQFIFEETTGGLTDTVAGLTVAKAGAGTVVYRVFGSGPYVGISPGITTVATGYFLTALAAATLDIGTSDFTFEMWLATTDGNATGTLFDTEETGGAFRGWTVFRTGVNEISLWLMATDSVSSVTIAWTMPTGWNNGVPGKLRIVGTRAGNAVAKWRGATLTPTGSASLSAVSGKTISAYGRAIGIQTNATLPLAATFYEMRLSLNAVNNSGGDGGG